MPLYKTIRKNINCEKFMNFDVDWNIVRNLVQLRANLSQIGIGKTTVKLNSLCTFYDVTLNSECICCSLDKNEIFFHVMFECSRYLLLRRKFLSDYEIPTTAEDYYKYFVDIDVKKATDSYLFIKYALVKR